MIRFDSEEVLIVGYPGRLARAFSWIWPAARRVGRSDFDITDRNATVKALEQLRPQLVINCAAMTAMAQCDHQPDMAWAVNVRGVRNLAEGCLRVGALLVHFSSDYAQAPVNEYAWTKRASESIAPLTLRAKIYDASHWAWLALQEGRPIRLLTNEFLNPISTTGVVSITEAVLLRQMRGLITVGTAKRLNYWQVGRQWANVLGVDEGLIEPVERLDTSLPRLADMYMDTSMLQTAAVNVPTLAQDAAEHWQSYRHNSNRRS